MFDEVVAMNCLKFHFSLFSWRPVLSSSSLHLDSSHTERGFIIYMSLFISLLDVFLASEVDTIRKQFI